NALTPNDQDALDSAAGGNFLDKIPREFLSIIESKSKVIYSRSRFTDVRANANAPLLSPSHSNSFELQQIAASLEDKLDIRMNRFEKSLNKMKNSFITPTAPLKAVAEYSTTTSNNFRPQQSEISFRTVKINTILNPKREAKAITTRSGKSYKEPPIPPSGVDQQEPVEGTTDTELPSFDDIQPPLVHVEFQVDKPAEEPSVDVAESITKNLILIPNECIIVSKNGSQSTKPINDNPSDFTIISNPLSDVESNSDESTSNTVKNDEFYELFIPIHILEEERTRREHIDYINRMERLFTINPHNLTTDNTNVESFSSFQILNQESEPCQEEIDVVSETNDVLPPSDEDSDDEVNVVGDLRVDNVIQNFKHEYSESEDSDLDNPLLPLPPPKPPDKEFDFEIDFEKEISVERNLIDKFECIDARIKFDVFNAKNDVFEFIMFSLLSAESEDTIFDPGISE
nr:hypothetical protein [Tanacetum cinerariifolium]